MRIFSVFFAICMFVCLAYPHFILADSTDQHIKNLKSDDPNIRARAAFALGCS